MIIDVGANVGLSMIYFARQYPNAKIIGIEADHNVFTYLQRNLKNYDVKNYELINAAAWIHNQGILFGMEGADGESVYASTNKVLIPSVRLSEIIAKHTHIDMLKIDIEGAEYEVILDCDSQLHKVKHLFIEYHSWSSQPQKLSEILAILEKNKFRYYMTTINQREQPFTNQTTTNMDLQINIFAIKQL